MQIPAITTLQQLVVLTAPGAAVAPVVASLDSLAQELATSVRPALVQARASAWMLGEVDRVHGAATTLRDSLAQLSTEGMKTFDPAFSADDASWDAWFNESAELLHRAADVVAAAERHAPTTSTASV